MEDLTNILINKVLLFESDTLPQETEKILQQLRREKPSIPAIYVSSGTSSIIAGSEKTMKAAWTYIEENSIACDVISVGSTAPSNF